MSQRNGDRSRSHSQKRHKAKLRARRRALTTYLTQPIQKVTRIDAQTTDAGKAGRL